MLTREQKERRREGVGASDVPIILGLTRYRTIYDLWLEKTGRKTDDAAQDAELARFGSLVEPALLDMRLDRDGKDYTCTPNIGDDAETLVGSNPWELATPDYMLSNAELARPGDLKMPANLTDWGASETGEVPMRFRVQSLWQQHVMSATTRGVRDGELFAKVGYRFGLYVVPFDEPAVDEMRERVEDFWRLVKTDTPPEADGSRSSMQMLTAIHRADKSAPPLEPDEEDPLFGLCMGLHTTQAAIRKAQADEAAIQCRVMDAMGAFERVAGPWGEYRWLEKKGARKTKWKAVLAEVRAIVKAGGVPSTGTIDDIIDAHTSTGAPTRSFDHKAPKEPTTT